MMRLKKVIDFQKSVFALSAFISEANFRFNEQGLSLKAIDPSQIVFVDFKLPRKAFDAYKVEPTLAGIDVSELNKIMQRCLPNDVMEMDLTDSELSISLKGEIEREFRLSLIDVSDEEINIPQKTFDAQLSINSRMLREALKDAGLFGSSVVLKAKQGKLFIEARGSTGQFKSVLNDLEKRARSDSEVTSKYSLSFFSNIIKETGHEQKIDLFLKTDSPMKIEYSLGEASLKFHLAHMIL